MRTSRIHVDVVEAQVNRRSTRRVDHHVAKSAVNFDLIRGGAGWRDAKALVCAHRAAARWVVNAWLGPFGLHT